MDTSTVLWVEFLQHGFEKTTATQWVGTSFDWQERNLSLFVCPFSCATSWTAIVRYHDTYVSYTRIFLETF